MNWVPHQEGEILCMCVTVVCRNLALFHYFLVEMSLMVLAIFLAWQQVSELSLKVSALQVQLRQGSVVASRVPEPSIQSSCMSYLSHGSTGLCPLIPVVSISHVSSASAEVSPCIAVLFWRLFPSHSQVCHLRSACLALNIVHCNSHLPHHLRCRNLHVHPDCFQLHWASTDMLSRFIRLATSPFQHMSCLPALAESLSLWLQLAFLQ